MRNFALYILVVAMFACMTGIVVNLLFFEERNVQGTFVIRCEEVSELNETAYAKQHGLSWQGKG